MPVNKAARYRFEIIDECLRNTKRKWSKAILLLYVNRHLELHYGEETSISNSQLRYDLENMQSEYGAPIEMYKEGRNYFYKYDDPSFSIKNIPIAEDDITKLNNVLNFLQQIKGFTIADEMAEVLKRLESRYNFKCEAEGAIISFQSSPSEFGMENLEDIYYAIIRKTVLKINYQSFHATEPRLWHIHPYLLKEYNNRWYLLGYAQEKEKIGIYALDRMKDIRVSNLPYAMDVFNKCEDYFRDVIGITILPEKSAVEHISLLFSADLAPYIQTMPLHHSQRLIHAYDDGQIEIELRLIINPELISMLLSFGSNVKVQQPASLANEIHKVAQQLLLKYKL
ncbi:MAG: helix-turn-helix transcriptional regulator [Flavipsychrobacter sp.]